MHQPREANEAELTRDGDSSGENGGSVHSPTEVLGEHSELPDVRVDNSINSSSTHTKNTGGGQGTQESGFVLLQTYC